MDNSKKIILDLCGGTGSWSKPYKEAGYDVRLITLPEYDVLTYEPPIGGGNKVHGVIAAPPCTHFSIACNRLWDEKDKDGRTIDGLKVLIACLRIIAKCNPVGQIGRQKKIDAISVEEKILLMVEAIAVLEEGDADEREDKT